MFKKILITNRGDVALRVLRACKELESLASLCTRPPMPDSMPVLADESVCIGPPSSAESYLNIPAILSAVAITGADAVHPVGFVGKCRFRRNCGGTWIDLYWTRTTAHSSNG